MSDVDTSTMGRALFRLVELEIGRGNTYAAMNVGFTLTHVLEDMETLSVGQAADLKIDRNGFRVWMSRCSVEDGEPFDETVYLEEHWNRGWRDVGYYDGATELGDMS